MPQWVLSPAEQHKDGNLRKSGRASVAYAKEGRDRHCLSLNFLRPVHLHKIRSVQQLVREASRYGRDCFTTSGPFGALLGLSSISPIAIFATNDGGADHVGWARGIIPPQGCKGHRDI
jgi:hypothetical protein